MNALRFGEEWLMNRFGVGLDGNWDCNFREAAHWERTSRRGFVISCRVSCRQEHIKGGVASSVAVTKLGPLLASIQVAVRTALLCGAMSESPEWAV
jgi:hypothetical protein